MLKVKVHRVRENESTLTGSFLIDDHHMCDTLEDPVREKKIYGRTAIPEGTYKIVLRDEGILNERYKARYPEMHKGMLHIPDVPGFTWILIHGGTTAEDTLGCVLVGYDDGPDKIKNSSKAYKIIYPVIADAILKGEEVTIEIINIIN
jgi:hypothetical protein